MIIEYVGGVVSVGLISYIMYTRRKLQKYTVCKQAKEDYNSDIDTYFDFYIDHRYPIGTIPPNSWITTG